MRAAASKRTINGKVYRMCADGQSKQSANRIAGVWRTKGWLVRVFPLMAKYTSERYAVYFAAKKG